jgi:hypothetical protein
LSSTRDFAMCSIKARALVVGSVIRSPKELSS